MRYDPNKHHRRSIRLAGYPYYKPGLYYVTFATHNLEHLFGRIEKGEMRLNKIGEYVRSEWLKTEELRPNVKMREFVIMPNHIHAIIELKELPEASAPEIDPRKNSIGAIIRGFKGATMKRINQIWGTQGKAVWHRNYYERVVRMDELDRIQRYIKENPGKWKK
jgi:putative transposase